MCLALSAMSMIRTQVSEPWPPDDEPVAAYLQTVTVEIDVPASKAKQAHDLLVSAAWQFQTAPIDPPF